MLSATASVRSRPLSLHSSRRAKRFVPSCARFCALFSHYSYCNSANTSAAAGPAEVVPQTNSREWLERLRAREFCDDFAGDRGSAYLFRVFLAAGGPDPGFSALDRKLPGDREKVFYIEAGATKLTDPRGDVDHVSEFYGLDEIGSHINERDPHDAECARELMRLYSKCGLEHSPGACVEHFEEAAV